MRQGGRLRPGPGSAVQHCLKAWLGARGGAGNLTEVQAQRRLLDFIGRHGARCQDKSAGADDRQLLNRAGFRENLCTGETVYYIFREPFTDEICEGLDPMQAARTLADMGILKCGENNRLQRNERLPGIGVQRVYVVSLSGGEDRRE